MGVKDLKRMISAKTDNVIPVKEQRLTRNGEEAKNDTLLSDYEDFDVCRECDEADAEKLDYSFILDWDMPELADGRIKKGSSHDRPKFFSKPTDDLDCFGFKTDARPDPNLRQSD